MRPFRFRAAVALELRAADEERARQRLAHARMDLQQAEQRVQGAAEAARAARADLASAHAEGSEAWRLGWHRSWMVRQEQQAAATRSAAAVSAAAVAHATASVHAARQRRRALERLRDRAHKRYQADAARYESKEMNLLANARYLAVQATKEGTEP